MLQTSGMGVDESSGSKSAESRQDGGNMLYFTCGQIRTATTDKYKGHTVRLIRDAN